MDFWLPEGEKKENCVKFHQWEENSNNFQMEMLEFLLENASTKKMRFCFYGDEQPRSFLSERFLWEILENFISISLN